jgi:formate-dependent nitrite reductase membrane component NrfD
MLIEIGDKMKQKKNKTTWYDWLDLIVGAIISLYGCWLLIGGTGIPSINKMIIPLLVIGFGLTFINRRE